MISVIVPVYKVEKYLAICIESIMKQTYKDFELILVDDGSPDKCPQLCDKYAEKYSNIMVLHKTNGGLSEARNYGVAFAKGEYITFVDSDDYVSNDYLENLISLLDRYNAEIAVTGISVCYEGKKKLKIEQTYHEYCFNGVHALENMLYQKYLDSSACAMLVPINVVRKFPFPKGKYHEDEYTTYKYYLSVKKVAVSTKSQYFYVQRKDSIMHSLGQSNLDELDASDNYVNYCKNVCPQLISAAKSKKFSNYCQILLKTKSLEYCNPDIYKQIINYLYTEKKHILLDKRARIKNRVAALSLFFGLPFFKLINRIYLYFR